ncbi:hypothetical protein J3R83DRAFT_2216 [Lanmaoa asiatica]|nr:hypothetical protein J3R83DRAFT_2216 [Lanmaoa asiatica]
MAIISAAVFIIMFSSLLFQKVYSCAHDTWWYTLEPINCPLRTAVSASQLSTDATSDILLVILPTQLVREGSVPRDQRIILLSVFSSSILISLISVVHFVFMIEPDTYFQLITAQVEIALSVIVCNSLVVVTCLYKLLRRKGLDFAPGPTTLTSPTVCFTTIVDMIGLGSREEWSSAESDRKPVPQNVIKGQLHTTPDAQQS